MTVQPKSRKPPAKDEKRPEPPAALPPQQAIANMPGDEQFRLVVESAPCGMMLVDEAGVILMCNIQLERLFGYSGEELIGRPIEILVPERLRNQHQSHYKQYYTAPSVRVLGAGRDLFGLRKDGTEVAVEIGLTPVETVQGPRVLASVVDITGRKRTEEALRVSERRYKALVEAAPICIHEISLEGRLLSMNRAGLNMLGLKDEQEIVGLAVSNMVAPEDRERVAALLAKACAGESSAFEITSPTERGARRFASWFVPLRGEDGTVTRLMGITEDITGRKWTEHALLRSQTVLQAFVEYAPASVAMLDKDLRYLAVSKRWLQDYHLGEQNLIGRHHYDVFPEIRQREDWQEIHRRCLAGAIERREEDLFTRADGSQGWLRWEVRPWQDESGQTGGIIMFSEVITERRQYEEQLRQTQKMEAVGQLAGGIAHDFNNLLTALLGSCGFLRGGLPPGDPLIEEVDEIQKAGTRAATLTKHLLAFSRKQVLQPKVLDLNDVVAGMEGTLRRLIREDIALTITLGPSLWRVKVDPSQIEQAVLNLVLNACDAMPQGGRIAITTANLAVVEATDIGKSLLPPGSYATLTVSDSGCGMDAKTLAHLFEPFFTTKEVGKGTGLGLAMVHGIITQSGGHVGVANEPGRCAVFTIYLPRAEEPVAIPRPDAAPAKPSQVAGTILVVEDDEMIRTVARRVLEHGGYRVLTASYSDEALLLAGRHEGGIALLITDVVLPGMNGRELADRLRAARPAMKVLFISGYGEDAVVRHGVLNETLPFLQKPFTPDDLMRKVREVLKGGGG